MIAESMIYYDGFEPCGDSDGGINLIALGLIVATGVVVLAVGLGCFYRSRKNKQKTKAAMESDLGGFGATKPVATL